jgi:hypothetical protein
MTTTAQAHDTTDPLSRQMARRKTIREALLRCATDGPVRVAKRTADGFIGITAEEARREGIEVTAILVRDDGWTIGVGDDLELLFAVRKLWDFNRKTEKGYVAEAKWHACHLCRGTGLRCHELPASDSANSRPCFVCEGRKGAWEMYRVEDVPGV